MQSLRRVARMIILSPSHLSNSLCFCDCVGIGAQCTDYARTKKMETKSQHQEIMEVIAKKVEEESQPHTVGSIPDRYEADDDSYLKRVPKLNQR